MNHHRGGPDGHPDADQRGAGPAGEHPRLLIVGEGDVAVALEQIAAALQWWPIVVGSTDVVPEELPPAEYVVVLSHHEGVDGPTLAAALSGPADYVGAMGSRSTQARRREWLREHGVPPDRIEAVHGPAGLAIGADAPGEIAVSIIAEIIAVQRGDQQTVSAGSLKDRSGPLHPDLPPGTATCPSG